jgi:hypothetical protein
VQVLNQLEPCEIVRRGVQHFREKYGGKEYANGATAKLAIYCGTIERLEEDVYPLLIGELGIAPDDILKYHRGNAKYKIAADAEVEWRSLDTALSRKRIVLLVQIGKEGWDCRSLTGVILSQKGDCPTNMVLQTSCRCLRQMDGGLETAAIYLNAENAKILDKQLAEEQHTSIEEINKLVKGASPLTRPRFSRVDALRLPPLAFYQLRVCYQTETSEAANPPAAIDGIEPAAFRRNASTQTREGLSGASASLRFHDEEQGELADFSAWLLRIAKGSFGAVPVPNLRVFEVPLCAIFDTITFDDPADGSRRFNALYDEQEIGARIRLAFCPTRTLTSRDEVVSTDARLLVVENLRAIAADKKYLYPSEADVAEMQTLDAAGQTADDAARVKREQWEQARVMLEAQGLAAMLGAPPSETASTAVRHKDRAFHYVPYNFDSSFELEFLKEALSLEALRERGLELYFNGEGELTQFRIECYAPHGWKKVGKYTPDFLLVERKDGEIRRALIIETKGKGFAEQKEFVARRAFVQDHFLKLNNDRFGYARFNYLYLSDADDLDANLKKLCDTTSAFFTN